MEYVYASVSNLRVNLLSLQIEKPVDIILKGLRMSCDIILGVKLSKLYSQLCELGQFV